MASGPFAHAAVLSSWEMAAVFNGIISLCYFVICGTILRGLVLTRQLRTNPLAVATASIFLTCAVHHGAHSIHMVLPVFGIDRAHGLAFRDAFGWQMVVWDGVGAAVAAYYLSLRRTYGALFRTPAMFDDEVRRQSVEQLERQRELFARAEGLTKAGSWEVDLVAQRVRWSPGMYRLRGHEPGQEESLAVADTRADLHPDDLERVEEELAAATENGVGQLASTYRIVHDDGRILQIESRAVLERDETGKAVRITGVSMDVTERHAAEAAREAAERELRARELMVSGVIENSPALIYVKDLEGRYLLYNEPLTQALALHERGALEGKPAREVLLGRTDEWLSPELAPVWRENDERARRGAVIVEEWADHPSRGRLTFEAAKFPLFDADGALYATCGVSLETTERRRAEVQLDEAEQRLRGAFEDAPNGMALVSLDGRFTKANSALCDLIGHSCEALEEMTVFEITHLEDVQAVRATLYRLVTTSQKQSSLEVRCSRQDGRVVWTQLHFTLLRDPAERPLYLIAQVQDITERRRQEALASAHQSALEASRLKSEFLANMSHEIRTPLNGVIGMCGLLQGTPLSAEQREVTETIRVSGDALMAVINDILDFSKIEAGKLEIEREPLELRSVLDEVTSILAPAVQAKPVGLDSSVADEVPREILGDRNRLRQVVTNLVANAVKFTPRGKVTVRAVAATGAGDTRWVRIEVADTGIGIHGSSLEDIFTSFAQQDGSTTRRFGGTGLGLTISKQLVELMGGEIGARSTEGEGSTFWFTIPLETAEGRAGPAEIAAQPAHHVAADLPVQIPATDEVAADSPLLLVAEDNEINQRVAVGLLHKRGFRVDVAGDGRQVLEMYNRRSYAAVFMDCQMPGLDGYQATSEIRRREGREHHLPIIAMTANTMTGDRERCLDAGMDDYVPKPIRVDQLDGVIARVLAGGGYPAGGAVPGLLRVGGEDGEPIFVASLLSDACVDEEEAREVVELFLAQGREAVLALAEAVSSGDDEAIEALAHRLKASAAAVGALRLARDSDRLCRAVREQRLDAAAPLQAHLERSFESTCAVLDPTADPGAPPTD